MNLSKLSLSKNVVSNLDVKGGYYLPASQDFYFDGGDTNCGDSDGNNPAKYATCQMNGQYFCTDSGTPVYGNANNFNTLQFMRAEDQLVLNAADFEMVDSIFNFQG